MKIPSLERAIKLCISLCALTIALAGFGLLAVSKVYFAEKSSTRINSQSQLEERLVMKRKKMNIPENIVVQGVYVTKNDEEIPELNSRYKGYSWKVSDKHYKFAIVEKG